VNNLGAGIASISPSSDLSHAFMHACVYIMSTYKSHRERMSSYVADIAGTLLFADIKGRLTYGKPGASRTNRPMRPQPRRRPITRKDYAQGQGHTASLRAAPPRFVSSSHAPPRRAASRARARATSPADARETLRQIRETEMYARVHVATRAHTRATM